MSHRGVTLTLSLFLLSSILPLSAQKNTVVPKTTNPEADRKAQSKKAETQSNVLKGWANDAVSIIITDTERSAFKKLTRDEERENFIENFWILRDPTPDTQENEFREQFYERVDYANDHYTSGVAGMRTDRGRMYILNGPADEVQSHPSGGTYYRSDEEGGGVTNTFPFETWRYRHLDGKGDNMIYEFVDQSMSGEYKLEYDPGAKDALRNVPGAGLTAYEQENGLDKSERYNKTNTLLTGMSAALPANVGGNNEFDMLQKYNEAYKPPDVKLTDLIVPVSTRLSSAAILPFKVQPYYVRVADTEVRTLITVQVMNRDLSFQDGGDGQRAEFVINGALYRKDNRRMPGFSQDVKLELTPKQYKELKDQPSLFQETQYLTPGTYRLHLTITDKHSPNIGIQDILLNVPRIPEQTLQASSMILAYSVNDLAKGTVGTEQFALGDKKIKPNVTGVYKPDQVLNVWQEFYGLTVDQTTHKPSATIELVISQNKQEVKKIVTESTELAGSGQQMKYTNSVPLTDFGPGQYDVQVKVTDNLSKEPLVTTNKFTVTAGSAK